MRARAAFLALVLALMAAALRGAEVRVADFDGGGDDAACAFVCTRACRCASLRAALLAAQDGDDVWVVPPSNGSTIPCENAHANVSVALRTAPSSAHNAEFDCRHASRLLWLDGRQRAARLDVSLHHLTVVNGRASIGGCVRVDSAATVALSHCTFVGCQANTSAVGGGGGAVAVVHHTAAPNSELVVANCTFRDCASSQDGGAVLIAHKAQAIHKR